MRFPAGLVLAICFVSGASTMPAETSQPISPAQVEPTENAKPSVEASCMWRPTLDASYRFLRDSQGRKYSSVHTFELAIGAISPWRGSEADDTPNELELFHPSLFFRAEEAGENPFQKIVRSIGNILDLGSGTDTPSSANYASSWLLGARCEYAFGYARDDDEPAWPSFTDYYSKTPFERAHATSYGVGVEVASVHRDWPTGSRTAANGTRLGVFASDNHGYLSITLGGAHEFLEDTQLDEISVELHIGAPAAAHSILVGYRYQHAELFTQNMYAIGLDLKF